MDCNKWLVTFLQSNPIYRNWTSRCNILQFNCS
jgi:hypothetical protein